MSRDLDIVVFGATGCSGRAAAKYLSGAAPALGLRWAIAGRDRAKLERVRDDIGAVGVPIEIADAHDRAALDRLAVRSRVVCTAVGPYARHGSDLVAACAAAGTHYCDITGEVLWIREMIDAHHERAQSTGARIVHCCGFDSIPSDLGVHMLHAVAVERGEALERVDAFFGESKGGFAGGSVATIFNVLDTVRRDPDARRRLADPYMLDPVGGPRGFDRSDLGRVRYEPRLRRWTAPWMMAPINARVVRRSNALAGYPYGESFRYREVMSLPGGVKGMVAAASVAAGLAGMSVGSQIGPLRKLLERRLPAPGEGPSEQERAGGYWVVRMIATLAGGGELRARISDRRDPAIDSTGAMLAESALCLARDDLFTPTGVTTPATALDGALLSRLRRAGFTFAVGDTD